MTKSVKDYINNVLREKRDEFGCRAVCPFAGPELDSNKLMIATVGEKNLLQLIHEFKLSDYESALFVIKDEVGVADVHDIIVATAGGHTIDGTTSVQIESPFGAINIYSNGANKYFIY